MALAGLLLLCQFFGTPQVSTTTVIGARDPILEDFDADGQPDIIVNNMFLAGIVGEFILKSSRTGQTYHAPSYRPLGICQKVWMGKFTSGNTIDFITIVADTTDPTYNLYVYLHTMSAPGVFNLPILVYAFNVRGAFSAFGSHEFRDAQGTIHLVATGTIQAIWNQPRPLTIDIAIDKQLGITANPIVCPLSTRVRNYKTLYNAGLATCDLVNKIFYIESTPGNFIPNYPFIPAIVDFEVADMDQDGNDDIVLYDETAIQINYLDAGGSVKAITTRIPLTGGSYLRDIALGLIDNDNNYDIIEYINTPTGIDQLKIYTSTANFANPATLDLGIAGRSYNNPSQQLLEFGTIRFCKNSVAGDALAVSVTYGGGGYMQNFIFPIILGRTSTGMTYRGSGGIDLVHLGIPSIGNSAFWLISYNPVGGDIVPIVGSWEIPGITAWPGMSIFMQFYRFSMNPANSVNGYTYYSLPIPEDTNLASSLTMFQLFGLGQNYPLAGSKLGRIVIQ